MSSPSQQPLKLYGYWRSSASWRVRWALELKGLKYEYVPVNLLTGENRSEANLKRNPAGAVPILEVSPGDFIAESVAILEWLEEEFFGQGVRLFPATPRERARVRQLVEIVNAMTAPLQTPRAQKAHSDVPAVREAWARRFIDEGLDAFNKVSAECRGQFCVGDSISAADLFLIPQVYNALRFSVNVVESYPWIDAHYQRLRKTPECSAAAPEAMPDAQ